MSTAPLPAPLTNSREARQSRPRPRRALWIVRLPLAALLASAGVLLFFVEKTMRQLEVALSAHLLPVLFATQARTAVGNGNSNPVILFQLDGVWMGLRLTPECSIAFYVGAILLFGALMSLIARFSLVRVLLATAIAVVIMITLNQARLAGLAFVFGTYGHDAFDWAHTIGGSFLMIAGLAVDLTLFFLIVVRGRRRRRARRAPGGRRAPRAAR